MIDNCCNAWYNKQFAHKRAQIEYLGRRSDLEKYSRGWRGAPAKGVGRSRGARVQIPLSPLFKRTGFWLVRFFICYIYYPKDFYYSKDINYFKGVYYLKGVYYSKDINYFKGVYYSKDINYFKGVYYLNDIYYSMDAYNVGAKGILRQEIPQNFQSYRKSTQKISNLAIVRIYNPRGSARREVLVREPASSAEKNHRGSARQKVVVREPMEPEI